MWNVSWKIYRSPHKVKDQSRMGRVLRLKNLIVGLNSVNKNQIEFLYIFRKTSHGPNIFTDMIFQIFDCEKWNKASQKVYHLLNAKSLIQVKNKSRLAEWRSLPTYKYFQTDGFEMTICNIFNFKHQTPEKHLIFPHLLYNELPNPSYTAKIQPCDFRITLQLKHIAYLGRPW